MGGMAGFASRGLVGLLDHRVVLGLAVATIGIGVAAVTTGRVAAFCRGVSTLGICITADRDGNCVAVPDLGVAGIGVAAITTRGVGVAAIGFGTSLRDARLVAL